MQIKSSQEKPRAYGRKSWPTPGQEGCNPDMMADWPKYKMFRLPAMICCLNDMPLEPFKPHAAAH